MTEIITHRGEPQPCPFCGVANDAHTGADHDSAPTAGDVAICLCCREMLIYGDDALCLRKPTDAEYLELAAEPGLIAAFKALDGIARP